MTGIIAYIDPQHFIANGASVVYNQKSDIYSLGVLFWELTSEIPPFNKFPM